MASDAEVVLTGSDLTLDQVVAVGRGSAGVRVAADALRRMRDGRAVVDRAVERGDAVYGATTGLGASKRTRVARSDQEIVNRLLILNHRVGQGPEAAPEAVRATLVRLVNGFATGRAGVRPALAERLVAALNDGAQPRVRLLGSLGQADLAPLADLAHELLGDLRLAPLEGLALTNNNAFATGLASLAIADCRGLMDALDAAASLDLEAFGANLGMLHPLVAFARRSPGLELVRDRLAMALEESPLWAEDGPRNLQDPLTFRCVVQIHGGARDALEYVLGQLAAELNSHRGNPLVLPDEDRVVSVGSFDLVPLAAALDFLRIALAPALTAACERAVKLLQLRFSGLSEGLKVRPGLSELGLEVFAHVAVALAGEARLLAQPVSFELPSTSLEEGIEDRMTFAPLGARRLAEMVCLGERLVAIELLVAAQAIDLRQPERIGRGVARLHGLVREIVPFTGERAAVPADLEPLVAAVRSGAFAQGTLIPDEAR